MRHITDGELHAYLDGALAHLPERRGDEVRDHLEECSTCRERLEDERKVRDEAQELLDLSAPIALPLPSFEELRARAEASESREAGEKTPVRFRGPLRGMPLAWAATVVLALGVGWMGGGIWRSSPRGAAPHLLSDALYRSESEPDVATEAEAGAPGSGGAEVSEEVPAEPSSAALDAFTVAGVRAQDSGRPAAGETVPSSVGGVEPTRNAAERLEAREKVSEEIAPGAGIRRDAAVPQAAVIAPPSPAEEREGGDQLLYRSRGGAEESSLLVPGLDVVSVEWEEWVPGERALHIRQLLPMGDTLELRYLGLLVGSDPDVASVPVAEGIVPEVEGVERPLSPKVMEASLPPGWNQVVMHWGRGWLVARAPLPVESLRGILRSLH